MLSFALSNPQLTAIETVIEKTGLAMLLALGLAVGLATATAGLFL